MQVRFIIRINQEDKPSIRKGMVSKKGALIINSMGSEARTLIAGAEVKKAITKTKKKLAPERRVGGRKGINKIPAAAIISE